MLEKPAIGQPCNGCGLCCRAVICAAGSFTMGLVRDYGERAPGPCPALKENEDGSAVCAMVLRPRDFAPGKGAAHDLRAAIGVMIGAGIGCDDRGDDDSAEADAAIAAVQHRFLERHGHQIDGSVKKWFGL